MKQLRDALPRPEKIDGVQPERASGDGGAEPTKDPPLPVKANPAKKNKTETCHCKPDKTPLWKMVTDALLVIVGGYVAWVYSNQLTQMINANNFNRDALVSVQRAFVTYPTVQVKGNIDKVTRVHLWRFNAAADNSGTTPAKSLHSFFDMGNAGEPTEQQFRGDHLMHPHYAGPKHELRWGNHVRDDQFVFGRTIPANEPVPVEVYSNGKVYFWGWSVYQDVFPRTPWHLTEFCYQLVGIEVQTYGSATDTQSCETHNCTDDDCEDYDQIVKWAMTAK